MLYLITAICFSFTPLQAAVEYPTPSQVLDLFASCLKTKKQDPKKKEPFHQEDIANTSVPVVFVVVPLYELNKETKTLSKKTFPPAGNPQYRLKCFMAVDKKAFYEMYIYQEEGTRKWKKESIHSSDQNAYESHKGKKGALCFYLDKTQEYNPYKETWLSEEEIKDGGYKIKE